MTISNWPERLEPKYLVLAKDARKVELVDGELEDITGPYQDLSVKVGNDGSFPALRRIPEAEIFSFSRNKIKNIKADTFKYNPKLREIYLDQNEIATVSPDAFNHLNSLEKLVLRDNKLTRVPHGLPPSLGHLDLMNNLCGQTTKIADIIVPERLSYLNLCGNYLQNSTVFRRVSFANIDTLCVGDKGPQLPLILARNLSAFMRLQNLTLSAKRNEYTELADRTTQDLRKLSSLIELNLDYYKLRNVDFILPLEKLEILRLHNVALLHKLRPDTLRVVLQNKKNLRVLSLDGSPDLVDIMRPVFMCFPDLQAVSLQQTGLSTIRADDFSSDVVHNLQLDISYNPLTCDNDLDWIHTEMSNSSGNFSLLGAERTFCTQPHVVRLVEFQAQNAQVVVINEVEGAAPQPALGPGFRTKYLKNIVTAGDVIIACLTAVPAIILIVYILATIHKRKRSQDTAPLVEEQ